MGTIKVALLEQPGDVFVGQAEIDAADFDERFHVRAAEYGGDCDNAPGRYCWNRVAKRFDPIHSTDSQRVQDFVRMADLGVKLAAAHLQENTELGADAAEYLALARRHFPQHVRATLAAPAPFKALS